MRGGTDGGAEWGGGGGGGERERGRLKEGKNEGNERKYTLGHSISHLHCVTDL
jgi:hypothetical protein